MSSCCQHWCGTLSVSHGFFLPGKHLFCSCRNQTNTCSLLICVWGLLTHAMWYIISPLHVTNRALGPGHVT